MPKVEAFDELEVARSDVSVPPRHLAQRASTRLYEVVLGKAGVPNPIVPIQC